MKTRFVALACCIVLLAACAPRARAEDAPTVKDALKTLENPDVTPDTRTAAVMALANFGPKAESAVPALKRLLAAPDNAAQQGQVIRALGTIGKAGVPVLVECLKDKALDRAAIFSLTGVGAGAADAVPPLLKMLDADDLRYSLEIFTALQSIGADAKDVVPAALKVAKKFGGKKDTVYLAMPAVEALQRAGPAAKEAVPYLVGNLQKEPGVGVNTGLIKDSIQALGAIGPDAKDALDPLRGLLKSPLFSQDAQDAIAKIKAKDGE